MDSITLLIVHPDRFVRDSLSATLTQHGDFTVVDTSDGRDGEALAARMSSLRVDVAMLFERIAGQPAAHNGKPPGSKACQLTRRELQILTLVETGLAKKEIARRLSLEVQTVKNHVHNVLRKLRVHRRTEAARYARLRGLLPQSAGI